MEPYELAAKLLAQKDPIWQTFGTLSIDPKTLRPTLYARVTIGKDEPKELREANFDWDGIEWKQVGPTKATPIEPET